ncbi:MAG: type II toxin-antitoxin system prevent-host-death family antitoxin [Rhodocyclaceae bacterium]|nr:type II toxin-antitoxin system prevent-host-death family antitoxin [Rhodocyclaceae bacterium]
MAQSHWQLQEAKNHFSRVVDRALAGEPQHVTRRGREVVVVVAADEFRRLKQGERRHAPGFIEHLLAIPRDDAAFERGELALRETDL